MGVCESKKEEAYTGHKSVPMNIANKTLKSICKIIVNSIEGDIYGTGFFMKINDSKKYLITNYHVISEERINDEIVIEIHNHKTMKLKKGNRVIKYFKRPKDITVIEIKNNDDIYKDIDFLDYDYNCVPNRYKFYENIDVFSIQHPLGDNAACGSGTIININNYEFEHTISTDNGSSGCPIILLNSNINFIQVIGIHKNANVTKKLNYGTFIGEIFNTNYSNKNINSVVSFAEPKEVPFNDNDIYFQYSEKVIDKNSKELVSSIFQKIKDNDVYVINVVDVRNKKKQKDEETIKITFKSASGMTKDININQNKTIEELIKLFFSEINKPELFNDNDVNFLYSAKVINKNPKELVSEIFKKVLDNDVYVVTIVDLKNKINS